MKEIWINGLKLYVFQRLTRYAPLCHCVSTRIGGVSGEWFSSLNLGVSTGDLAENILENHKRLLSAAGLDINKLVSSSQVHGDGIGIVHRMPAVVHNGTIPSLLSGYDSLITALPGVALMIRVADCVPVILFDTKKRVLAVVHAGWKGTLKSIAAKTVECMVEKFASSAADIVAGIGPSIGRCCFEVGGDVTAAFTEAFSFAAEVLHEDGDKGYIDLKAANRYQLTGAGLHHRHIETSPLCTCCSPDSFFSHRREKGKTGRFALVAGIRG